jgi:hypothetical protein
MLLRPSLACPIFINIELKERAYTTGEHLCPKDGFVSVINSDLISGRIGKKVLGGDKAGLFSVMAARYSPTAAGALFPTSAHQSKQTRFHTRSTEMTHVVHFSCAARSVKSRLHAVAARNASSL